MKSFFIIIALFFSIGAFASDDVEILAKMLESQEVKDALKNKDLTDMKFSKTNEATTWTYTAVFTTEEKGYGEDGPSEHPCTTFVNMVTSDGKSGTVVNNITVDNFCAENKPKFDIKK